jgi:hypothetical protein
VTFIHQHFEVLDPVSSDLRQAGQARLAVATFAATNDLPVVQFVKGDRKMEVIRANSKRRPLLGALGWP